VRYTIRTLRRHLADPLFRNGYALMANTGITGLLGVFYWLLAARHYPAVDVGRASAAYSAMNLLSGFTAFNLVGALTRFIPQAGKRTGGLVLRAYAFSSAASILVAAVFLLGVGHLGASYTELSGFTAGLIFTACIICWGIFTLQDGVLVGLRSAVWVPVENGTFGVVKIVMLLALAATLSREGIYLSWMLPVALSLPLVNGLIFGYLVSPHARRTATRPPPSTRQIGRFLAGDYTGATCVLAVSNLVPVVVAATIGPSVNV
jgi:O-antigen/teichoic acid export membrane protein